MEYDKAVLEMSNTVVEIIEKEEDLTTDRLAAMNILYQPERVIIEYNGMWLVAILKNAEAGGLGSRAADHLCRRQHLPDVYGKHEIYFYGHGKKQRYGCV